MDNNLLVICKELLSEHYGHANFVSSSTLLVKAVVSGVMNSLIKYEWSKGNSQSPQTSQSCFLYSIQREEMERNRVG